MVSRQRYAVVQAQHCRLAILFDGVWGVDPRVLPLVLFLFLEIRRSLSRAGGMIL
jgi:hypothetical protein